MCHAAAFLLAKLEEKKKELLCRFALLLHSSSFNWKTSSIMLCMTIFLCHFLPAHHNIIRFHFSSQGPMFSFIQDNSCEAQPWCLLQWWSAFVFCFSLSYSNFHSPAWQIFLQGKKMHSALKLPRDCAKELRVLSTCLYCNLSLSQAVLEICWED